MLCLSGCCDITITGSADRGGQGFTISLLNFDGYTAVDIGERKIVATGQCQCWVINRRPGGYDSPIFCIQDSACAAVIGREVFVSRDDCSDSRRQSGCGR